MDDTQDKVMPKPRGKCTGCKFDYTLSVARSGEHKGESVTRKHLSRTGSGECEGSRKPPRGAETEELPHDAQETQPDPFTAPAPADGMTSEAREEAYGDLVAETVTVPQYTILDQATNTVAPQPDPFQAPGAASDIPEKTATVSGQPDPDRDRWDRYLIHGQAHTRATTFAKLGANTKAIEKWNERNVIVGLTLRDDLLMLAAGKEVKRDKKELNSIAEQAKTAAGNKVAANIGTGYHSFTERVDAGQMTVDQVPERYRARVQQYVDTVRAAGITFRPEWIERTTAVRADQVSAPLPVAGMLDRIGQLPDGSLCIVDLKTGADLSYGEMEIEVQLALYAHGVNTHGLFDWNTKTWQDFRGESPGVREDIAIVIHLPADGDGCTMYVADIERGWADAQKLGQLQGSLKTKNRFRTLTRQDLAPVVEVTTHVDTGLDYQDPWAPAHMVHAHGLFTTAPDKPTMARLYEYALKSGKFTEAELGLLLSVGTKRLRDLGLAV